MLIIVDSVGQSIISRGLVLTIGIVVIIAILALYLLRSFGLYILAKNRGADKLFMAFLPILWVYTAAKIASTVTFFGIRVKKFAFWATLIIGFSMCLNLTYNLLTYIPLVGYYLQGGQVYIPTTAQAVESIKTISSEYLFDRTFYVGTNIAYPYALTRGFATTLNVMMITSYIFDIIQLLLFINIYLGIFKKYWTRHVMAGTLLSIFGFFGIMVFVIRKNKEINVEEYMRSQAYGMGNPNAYQPNRAEQERERAREAYNNDPFTEFRNEKDKPPEDPFSEFSNGIDNNDKNAGE